MKGESLYQVYCEELAKVRELLKPPFVAWKNLLPSERAAWNETARFVQSLVTKALG